MGKHSTNKHRTKRNKTVRRMNAGSKKNSCGKHRRMHQGGKKVHRGTRRKYAGGYYNNYMPPAMQRGMQRGYYYAGQGMNRMRRMGSDMYSGMNRMGSNMYSGMNNMGMRARRMGYGGKKHMTRRRTNLKKNH